MRYKWIVFLTVLVIVAVAALAAVSVARIADQPERPQASFAQDALSDPVFDQRVSAEFKDATISEVLDWLGKTKVNFLAPTMAKTQRVTLKVKDVPLRDVLRALSDVFDLTLSKQGEVYTLKPRSGGLFMQLPRNEIREPFSGFLDEKMLNDWLKEFGRLAPQDDPNWDKKLREQIKEFLRHFGDMNIKVMPKGGDVPGGADMEKGLGFRFNMDPKALFDSITEEQWKKHDAQGYLTWDDLTPEQRRLAGEVSGNASSNVQLIMELNGKNLVIKGH